MEQFTIYCTPEQTKKAYELGAPICKCAKDNNDPDLTVDGWGSFDGYWLLIPTAEQMLNWLRKEKGFKFLLSDAPDSIDDDNWWVGINGELISSGNDEVKELAAIDAALDYLASHRK